MGARIVGAIVGLLVIAGIFWFLSEADLDGGGRPVYRLEYFEASPGSRGYTVVRIADDQNLSWRNLPVGDGLESLEVSGESYHMENLRSDAFEPGQELSLVREPDNPESEERTATAIMDASETLKAGYIPTGDSGRISRKLDRGEEWQCFSMWEVVKDGERKSLRVLLVKPDARVELPG